MIRTFFIALVGCLSLAIAPAALAVDGGFYLGAGFGGSSTDVDNESGVSFDDSDTAWKAFGGFHFLQFFAVEASYRDLGTDADITGYDASGLLGMPLGPIYLFGKLGVIDWDSGFSSVDGTDYLVGIGGSLDLFKFRLRAEIEYMDIGNDALMYSLGAAWLF